MPRLIIAEAATQGLERRRRYRGRRSPEAARRVAETIARQFTLLEKHPAIGRPYPNSPELRELVIPFGDAGYVTLYRHEPSYDAVYALAFRHRREAGY